MVLLAWALLVWLQRASSADASGPGVYAPPEARIVSTGQSCNGQDEGQSERAFAVREGDTLELTCIVKGHPHPQIRWTKTSSTSSDKLQEMNLSNETLRIKNITRQQAGYYCCRAENGIGQPAIFSSRVDVHYLDPPVLMVHQNVGEAKYYQERTTFLRCSANSSPPAQITWLRGGHVVKQEQDDGISVYKPLFVKDEPMVLKLKNMRDRDYTTYSCVASVRNVCGIENLTASFQLTNKTAPPQSRIRDAESLVINPGDRVFVQCDAVAGYPHPSLSWSRLGGRLPPNSCVSGGNFSLARAHREDAGTYYCEAFNRVGDPYRRPVTIVVRTLRQGRFWITPDPYVEDGNITIGRGVNITCQVEAVPLEELTYTWYKNGRVQSSTGHMVITPADVDIHPGTSSLAIINLKFTDFGTYTCVASLNNYAIPNISIDVNISSSTVAPTVTVPRGRSVVTVREGSVAELQCVVSGKPKPVLLWSRADRDAPMPDGAPHTESHDGTLRFVNATRNMTGTYRCQTGRYNGFNVTPREANVQLIVQYPPQVEPVASEIRQALGRRVSMRCAVLRALPARPLEYEWRRGGPVLRSGLVESLDIASLSAGDYGSYTCTVTNEAGSSRCLFNVTGRAYAPEFYYNRSHPIRTVGGMYAYQLEWTQALPEAVDRVKTYKLEYRQVGTLLWRRVTLQAQPLGRGQLHEHVLPDLQRPHSYQVRLTPVSQFGEGDTAAFLVHYKEDPPPFPSYPLDPNGSGTLTPASACQFEENLCGFAADPTGTFNWTRRSPLTRPRRPPNTGPTLDRHNTSTGHYMLLEASNPRRAGDRARLLSPWYSPPWRTHYGKVNKDICLIFYYHVYGKHVGALNVYVRAEGVPDSRVWGRSGNQGNAWHHAAVGIVPLKRFQLVFEGVRGNGEEGDMALDDISVMQGRCERYVNLKPSAGVASPLGRAGRPRRAHAWLVVAGSLGIFLLGR
uniref:MAM domain-containing glycosylphosphatidylinositol anchor protein 2-like isoform X1 n=1 Tax=Petromyzon marinus TaxID=7757 RepID=A0AAJ7TN53_PETMA|nr:MAM domain-containing glycosylphosphatidylinositol anchor protein 2-like isoform X1 [Petromyzon marinus]XP_032820944.1 MAM domain-containing glycosylphosphatidylinositol anchor protein 2-like isoform X1 [Petromyzon marinus]XP_032820945.1 MAM domain-containing glycosylphosphatidylinositol anchor protein 2-like isoform X1 [Petromyzon marinus]